MKKVFVSILTALVLHTAASAQDLQSIVPQVDKAATVKEFQQLATQFEQLANKTPDSWLPWYYAAYCNARAGWLLQDDGESIEPFADKADQQLNKALTLIDTAKHKRELSEIYVVKSIIYRDRVYINTMTMGPKYGPDAARYIQLALKTDPNNGRASYLAGWEKYATPKMWGGDKKIAKEYLLKAQQQLNAQDADDNPHWGKKETEELLGKL